MNPTSTDRPSGRSPLEDELLSQINQRIDSTPHVIVAAADRSNRGLVRAGLGAVAATAVIAGVGIVVANDGGNRDQTVQVAVPSSEASETIEAPVAGEPASPTGFAVRDGYILGLDAGKVYFDPIESENLSTYEMEDPYEGVLRFRLAGSDDSIEPMRVQPWTSLGMEDAVVATVGSRTITTPANVTTPPLMTEDTKTGPWFWTEADGTKWMATGLLSEITAALPHISYVDGAMVLGDELTEAEPADPYETQHSQVFHSERFRFTTYADSTTTFDSVDPRVGEVDVVDIGGKPGVRNTSGYLAWRIDATTTATLQPELGAVGVSDAELLATAAAVRPVTSSEINALPVWRGQFDERIVVTLPEDLRTPVGGTPDGDGQRYSVSLTDGNGTSVGDWMLNGKPHLALPFTDTGASYTLELDVLSATGQLEGEAGCPVTVTVPPKGETVEVELTMEC